MIEGFVGTKQETKKHILQYVKESIEEADGCFDYGTTKLSEIEDRDKEGDSYTGGNGDLYGYVVFSDYHVDVEARRLSKIKAEMSE